MCWTDREGATVERVGERNGEQYVERQEGEGGAGLAKSRRHSRETQALFRRLSVVGQLLLHPSTACSYRYGPPLPWVVARQSRHGWLRRQSLRSGHTARETAHYLAQSMESKPVIMSRQQGMTLFNPVRNSRHNSPRPPRPPVRTTTTSAKQRDRPRIRPTPHALLRRRLVRESKGSTLMMPVVRRAGWRRRASWRRRRRSRRLRRKRRLLRVERTRQPEGERCQAAQARDARGQRQAQTLMAEPRLQTVWRRRRRGQRPSRARWPRSRALAGCWRRSGCHRAQRPSSKPQVRAR